MIASSVALNLHIHIHHNERLLDPSCDQLQAVTQAGLHAWDEALRTDGQSTSMDFRE